MHEARCDNLIEATAAALDDNVVALMNIAAQRDNLGWSVNLALKRSVLQFKRTEWESHQAVQGLFR